MNGPSIPGAVRRAAARHRRPIAALLAGAATLLTIGSLRSSPEAPVTTTPEASSSTARVGEVSVPVLLDTPALAGAVTPGDLIDLVSIDQSGVSTVIAEEARVVDRPSGSSPLGGASALLLVAVPASEGVRIATAAATTRLTVIVHPALP